MIEELIDRATGAIDRAVMRGLANMPVAPASAVAAEEIVNPLEFWKASRVYDPQPVRIVAEPGGSGRARVVDLEGPSSGPGVHPGSRKLIARAHLRTDLSDAPTVLLLHGFATPVPWYEEWQCRVLARRGINAIRLDHPMHLRRRARMTRSGEGYMNGDPERLRSSMKQSVEDSSALITWAQNELSPQVSVLGVSLGGCTATLLAALLELHAVVAVAPFCDPATTLIERLPYGVRQGLGIVGDHYGPWEEGHAAAHRAWSRVLAPIIARNFPSPRTSAERITLIRPLHDGVVGPGPIQELGETWGCEMWDERHGHISVMNARGLTARMYDRLLRPDAVSNNAPVAHASF